ncbi:GntR family transcriptional regulator [Massilia sp. WF1]|uniref:FadR/GntR family transcriptional regulator n=1 Tax=unclassified Massilia TaxID=2609279 RepID=UPI00068E2430|nr:MULTISPECIES: FCD domain-containing protein [unclassified Massilia]ALK95780.1 GntR family transcriptional regulator [Massilia sp. WG5]KNZ68001.1 GntR family transcriptional regulator [Massilia sp. WF1]
MKNPNGAATLRAELLANVGSGHWKAGEKLPTERELCASYGIGRGAVRRILAEAKERGLITQTVGSGTFVAKDASALVRSTEMQAQELHISPAELMEARMVIEPMIANLVVRNATSADFLRMEECCTHAENAGSMEQFEVWDGALHQAIADATHNNLIKSVFQLMSKAREQGEWGSLKMKSLTPERRHAYQQEHRALVDALKDRDEERARLLTTEHLVRIRHNLLGY